MGSKDVSGMAILSLKKTITGSKDYEEDIREILACIKERKKRREKEEGTGRNRREKGLLKTERKDMEFLLQKKKHLLIEADY
ncbi:hypothetical protein NPIL_127461 [Nephila pilipes]|uniref:Uncharacterized protein n=1 Tax=Nephila pilipes TaxID=299642 RepID=A0A8X6U9P2_NEPPI|nr:hypothetical protein NPIL_127461 [Nephila pilipes]